MTRFIAILLALVLLALPLNGLAAPVSGELTASAIQEALDAGKALRFEYGYESSMAQELGEEFEAIEAVLNDLTSALVMQASGDALAMDLSVAGRGYQIFDLGFFADATDLYLTSGLLSGKTYKISYEALAAMLASFQEAVMESAAAMPEIDPMLLMPYLIPVSVWMSQYLTPVVEEGNVAAEDHPEAVKRESLTVTVEGLLALVDGLYNQLIADEALLTALAETEEGLTIDSLREQITAGVESVRGILTESFAPITLEMLYDEQGVPVSILFTAGFEAEELVRNFEIAYNYYDVEGMDQYNVDFLVTGANSALRAYLTAEIDPIVESDTQTSSTNRLMLGLDVKMGDQVGVSRMDVSTASVTGLTEETTDTEIALTFDGPLFETLFQALGFDQPHDLFVQYTIATALAEDGFVMTVQEQFCIGESRIPLLSSTTTVTPVEGSKELLPPEDAIDITAISSEEEGMALLGELLTNVVKLMTELESIFPELVPEASQDLTVG